MKNLLCLLALLLCTTVFAQPQQVVVGVSGNGYVTRQQDGARITQRGVTHWTNPKSIVSIYFYLHQPTTADLSLYAKGHSEIKVSYGKKDFKVNLQSDDFTKVPVGSIDIRQAGYVRIDLQGVSKSGESFGEIKQLIADNVTGKSNYVKDFSDYWGRRGPSVHWDMRYLKVILNGSTMKSQCPKKAKQCIATTWRPASGKVISECNTTPRQNAVFFSRYGVLLIHKTPKRFRMTKRLNCYAKAKMYTSESLATKAQADKVI